MFDIGWSEMAIIALVALVVLGPKQLPQAMRSFAQFSKKMRRYAQEFRAGVDNIVREAELEDAKKALDSVRAVNPKTAVKKLIDPTGEMTEEVKSVEAAAKQGDAKQIAKPPVDPTAPAVAAPAEPAAAEAPAAASAEPPVPMARRVSQPLQVAPPHSVRPPAPPAEVSEAEPAAKEEGAPRAADLRKQA